jgi:hypothetical protein
MLAPQLADQRDGVETDQHDQEHDTAECPREESNLRTRFRKPLLYPLSYEGAPSVKW